MAPLKSAPALISYMPPMTSPTLRPIQTTLRRASRCLGSAFCLVGLVLLAGSCSSTKGAAPSSMEAEAEVAWLPASPGLARSIEARSIEVSQMASDDDFVRLSDWFQSVGESAYPKLLDMAASPDGTQKMFALSVIAARRDARLLDPLQEQVPMSSLANQQHRYGMARALLMLGDTSGVPELINGMESPSRRDRALCFAALSAGTNAGIKFNSGASDQERAQSIAKWRQWWSEMDRDELLQR